MRLLFDHSHSVFQNNNPLIYLEAIPDQETPKMMFETGWVPYGNVWYQTQSARLKLEGISKSRQNQLKKINVSYENVKGISKPMHIEKYNTGSYWDFFFDDKFWGRVNFYEDQILYSCMTQIRDKKSYGTLSMYFLIQKYTNQYKYLYITDYFEQFSYKSKLPGFERWTGSEWVNLTS